MSRMVPRDRPLSDDDREYLHNRGEHSTVIAIDQAFPPEDPELAAEAAATEVVEEKPNWSVMTKAQLEAEVARVNAEFELETPLEATGTKQEIVDRLETWWATPDADEDQPPA